MNNENMRRAELHVHTKFSKNQGSLIEVLEAIEHAENLKLSAIAFCDYKNSNAFSEIINLNKERKSEVKIILGAELPFETTTQIIKTKGYSITILAKNRTGINVLQRLISTLKVDKQLNSCELLDLELLVKNRENLLIGSTAHLGEIYNEIKWWWDGVKDYKKMAEFYDFFEIFPARNDDDKNINKRIVELGHVFNIPVVATCNTKSKNINEENIRQEQFKINQLYYDGGEYYLRTTNEMLKEFDYLGEKNAYDVVLKNPNAIAHRIKY